MFFVEIELTDNEKRIVYVSLPIDQYALHRQSLLTTIDLKTSQTDIRLRDRSYIKYSGKKRVSLPGDVL